MLGTEYFNIAREGAHFSNGGFTRFLMEGSVGGGHSSICHDNVANFGDELKLTRRFKDAYVENNG